MATELKKQPSWEQMPRSMTVSVELGEMYADGEAVRKSDRKELLKRLRAGDIFTLTVGVQSYLQPDAAIPLPKKDRKKANHNFARFVPDELPKFAKSFKGRLFLRDHNRRSMADVGGKIIESEAVEVDGRVVFHQVLELVKPWAIEDALDGTMQTFSIGWDPKESGWEGFKKSLLCSLCMGPMIGRDGCYHMPGEEIEPTEANNLEAPVIVEALWTNVLGAETSEVAFPAVQGTGVKEIRAALSACIELDPPEEEAMTLSKALLAALSLSATATEDEAIAAANALRSERDEANKAKEDERKARLSAESTAKEAISELATERISHEKERQAAKEAAVKRLHDGALSGGLMEPGDKREVFFLAAAGRSLEEAEAYLETLGPVNPVGQPMESHQPTPDSKSSRLLSERQKKFIKQLGMTEEEFLANLEKGGQI